MSVVLGIGPPYHHDSSAALLVDGKLVAAVEEERFTRKKHATDQLPLQSVQYCLQSAGLRPEDIEHVAFAWSPSACQRAKWFYAADMLPTSLYAARKAISKARKVNRHREHLVHQTLVQSGVNPDRVKIAYVEHHLAHTASSYLFSGFQEAACMSLDGSGEYITGLLSEAKEGRIRKIKEFYSPNSLGLFYSTVTEYLGFESHDGEYKTMGMAPYGNPGKIDLSFMIRPTASGFKVNNEHVWVVESKRYRPDRMYSRQFVDWFGPPRQEDGLAEPYTHLAASTQKALEDIVIHLMEAYLSDSLQRHKTLCLAGGCALNVTMNRKLLMHPLVERIYIPPAAHDAGTTVGAAALVAEALGERMAPMTSAYHGPAFEPDDIRRVLDHSGVSFRACDDAVEEAADLLARGEVIGWFQGRMEFGPRALGNRSILGNPSVKGTRDTINAIVKFREHWRPFCPSVLREHAAEIFQAKQDSPFMTLSFLVQDRWRSRIPEVVHVDGSARPQTVDASTNPRFYALLRRFYQKTGVPLVLNTSLNRRGEPIVCSPQDALTMFAGCGLQHLFLEDFLVSKRA